MVTCWRCCPPPVSACPSCIMGGSCHKYHFCRDKHVFVTTKHVFCRDKKYACRDKTFVPTKLCLSRQIFDKHLFVATKTILVAAPANDTRGRRRCPSCSWAHGHVSLGCWLCLPPFSSPTLLSSSPDSPRVPSPLRPRPRPQTVRTL